MNANAHTQCTLDAAVLCFLVLDDHVLVHSACSECCLDISICECSDDNN